MTAEATPPSKPAGRGLAAAALAIAVVALVLGPVVAYMAPGTPGPAGSAGPAGQEGPPGPPGGEGFSDAFIWGHATVTDCTIGPDSITVDIDYINLGNVSASSVVATYTIYQFETPTLTDTGTVSIGTVPRLTAGSVSATSTNLECGLWGQAVDVSFTWT